MWESIEINGRKGDPADRMDRVRVAIWDATKSILTYLKVSWAQKGRSVDQLGWWLLAGAESESPSIETVLHIRNRTILTLGSFIPNFAPKHTMDIRQAVEALKCLRYYNHSPLTSQASYPHQHDGELYGDMKVTSEYIRPTVDKWGEMHFGLLLTWQIIGKVTVTSKIMVIMYPPLPGQEIPVGHVQSTAETAVVCTSGSTHTDSKLPSTEATEPGSITSSAGSNVKRERQDSENSADVKSLRSEGSKCSTDANLAKRMKHEGCS